MGSHLSLLLFSFTLAIMHPSQISIQDYTYHLPAERIALHPLQQRDASKLLIYKAQQISEDTFSNIAAYLPQNSLVVFNNSKVINARLIFETSAGKKIEIFCLEPCGPHIEYSQVMAASASSEWICLVGGAAKWKSGTLQKKIQVQQTRVVLEAQKLQKIGDSYHLKLSWQPAHFCFADIIEAAGNVPLPPYIKRQAEVEDESRYQTIYALEQGSVAAPTAGLHFTQNVFNNFSSKNIRQAFVTLHVGAGTFKPVKSATLQAHEMHAEWLDVSIDTIAEIKNATGPIAAVGTTSLRTIESLYWLGVKASLQPQIKNLSLQQWDVYEAPLCNATLSKAEALEHLILWLKQNNTNRLFTQTQLLIAPGYHFKIANILVTNFHQPQSTLLLLVAAAVGNKWKDMYAYAMENNFRFLSYGDANLIFING